MPPRNNVLTRFGKVRYGLAAIYGLAIADRDHRLPIGRLHPSW